ncbi:hypothetical protein CTAM01_03065 [Colletotrichum tamarilloi]|uniref:Uncharacterized protein n=1 Tax=Colletotrichum tamarilloi TaxID=1209934 RepID=A0ABQ9RL04_9PEZI|nr:uncharacterized protein CTAM01_03065 [Colletotrichum tamarilloi]KAK1506733.1 hypothetical protein CTAM01_03065 [Colletotrichum tamarilloi]
MDPLYVILAVPVAVAFCFLVILRKSLRRGWTRLRPQVNEWASLAMVALLEAFKKGIKDALKEVFKGIILTILREMTGFPKPCAAQGGAGGRCPDEPFVVHRRCLTRRYLHPTISDAPVLGLQRGTLQIMCSLGSFLDDMFSYDILHHGILQHGILLDDILLHDILLHDILHIGILYDSLFHHGSLTVCPPITASSRTTSLVKTSPATVIPLSRIVPSLHFPGIL